MSLRKVLYILDLPATTESKIDIINTPRIQLKKDLSKETFIMLYEFMINCTSNNIISKRHIAKYVHHFAQKKVARSNFSEIAFATPMGLNPGPPTHGETMYWTYTVTSRVNTTDTFIRIIRWKRS